MRQARAWAAAALAAWAAAAHAQPGGESYSLEAQGVHPGGASGSATYQALAILESVAASTPAAGASGAELFGGFLRHYRPVAVGTFTVAGSGLEGKGETLGVSTAAAVELGFSVELATQSLIDSTTIYLVYDRLGNRLDEPVDYTIDRDPFTGTISLLPDGGWDAGATYRVVIGSQAVDAGGSALGAAQELTLRTLLDTAQANVVRALDDDASRLEIPAGALPDGAGVVVFNTDPVASPDEVDPGAILGANARAAANGGTGGPVTVREINAYDASGNLLPGRLREAATLSLSFPDADGNGRVDAQSIPAQVRNLALYALDEKAGLWVRVPGSTVDPSAGTVSAPVPHFSVYAVMAVLDTTVSQAYAYPVPWRPSAGVPGRYGTAGGGITFVNLPQVGSIRIYTLSGMLVRSQGLDGALNWVWDGRNQDGSEVASGVYLWRVEAGGNVKTGKLMVIR